MLCAKPFQKHIDKVEIQVQHNKIGTQRMEGKKKVKMFFDDVGHGLEPPLEFAGIWKRSPYAGNLATLC